jgi:small-conductance mechanosensitive channel
MFESLQKLLLNKALDKPKKKKGDKSAREKSAKNKKQDLRSESGVALDDAIAKLESSGHKMEDLLATNEELLAQVKAEAAKKLTPERRALIEQAQRIRATKAKILDDLDDETRAKLYLTAIRAFTGRQ